MKGISKSLFASQARVRSAMADAAQASMDTLGYARGDSTRSPHDAEAAEAAASAFRRGDDGACDPDASLVLVLEHAVGFDEPGLFAAARVASAAGHLKGALARTLAARRDDAFFRPDSKTHDERESMNDGHGAAAHVFACRRDLRVFPKTGDALLVEAYAATDASYSNHRARASKCVARGTISLDLVLARSETETETGGCVRVPMHRALLLGGGAENENGAAYVSVRILRTTAARAAAPPPSTPPEPMDLLGPLIDLDAGKDADTSQSQTLTPRSLAARFPKRAKRVFFLRHGESRWNEAQREMQLSAMAKFDHPLNARGAGQAVQAGTEAARYHAASLRYDVEAFRTTNVDPRIPVVPADPATRKHVAWSRSFGETTRCFVSPLTRAAQTAALFLFASGKLGAKGLGGGGARVGPGGARDSFAVLSRSLREVKSTIGSLDTIGIERGDGVLRRAAEKLRDACHGGVPDAAYAVSAVAAMRAETDANDAFGRWWTSRDDADSKEEMDDRVDDFFETLRLEASDAAIVVGHSLWFQHAVGRLCRRSGSAAFVARDGDLVAKLTREKIGNCACVGLDVAFDARTGEASLEDALFLFGSGAGGGLTDDAG